MTATRLPVSAPAVRPEARLVPASASYASAASCTVRVIGPTASWDFATGSTPAVLTLPTDGLKPTTPATPAGAISCAVSVEVSIPTVSAARPAAVAAAEPADEPAGVLSVSEGSST